MKWAVYDLNFCPPSFDFCTFLLLARYHGAQGVWLIPGFNRHKPYGKEEQDSRLENIILPAAKLYGMQIRTEKPSGLKVCWPPYWHADARRMNGYTIGWLKSIKEPEPLQPTQQALDKANDALGGRKRIVVTIRDAGYQDGRNSSPDWWKWAEDHDAFVIHDYYKTPIDLDYRLAFYELASLNIGVSGGPFNLNAQTTHRPYLMLKFLVESGPASNAQWFADQGWHYGDQMPWAGKHQRIVWNSEDDYETIDREYKDYVQNQG